LWLHDLAMFVDSLSAAPDTRPVGTVDRSNE
jgi:hypothetical protein